MRPRRPPKQCIYCLEPAARYEVIQGGRIRPIHWGCIPWWCEEIRVFRNVTPRVAGSSARRRPGWRIYWSEICFLKGDKIPQKPLFR